MKNLRIVFLAIISFSILSLTSCKKDDDTEVDSPVLSSGTLTLKVDGASWSASLAVQAINSGGVLSVTGSDSNAKQCGITLVNITETGTYTIGGAGNHHQLRWTEGLNTNQSYIATGLAGSGTVTVSELSATAVKGTFSFTGMNTEQSTKSITEGSFSASF